MEGFTIVDGVSALIIVISAILAYSRGFVRECLSILGWVIAAVVAFTFAARGVPLVREIPYVSDFLEGCEPATIFAFAVLFAIVLVVVSIFTPIFSGAVQRSILGGLDQGLGFLFGVVRGVLLVVVAIIIYDRVVTDGSIPMIDDSRTARVVAEMSAPIDNVVPDDAPDWVQRTYNTLTSHCVAGGETPAEAAPSTDG